MKENNENKITRENWGGRTENENKREVNYEHVKIFEYLFLIFEHLCVFSMNYIIV